MGALSCLRKARVERLIGFNKISMLLFYSKHLFAVLAGQPLRRAHTFSGEIFNDFPNYVF
jgi:hypothetical protein